MTFSHYQRLPEFLFLYLQTIGESSPMLDERQSAISPLAYLAELLKYTTEHVKDGDNAITVDALETQFHQPFWRYLTQVGDDFVYVDEVDKPVRHVRGCIEVLRNYLDFWQRKRKLTPQQRRNLKVRLANLEKEEANYLFVVYRTLLNQIGTSYDDLRRAVTLEDKESLANRLGIHAHHIDDLRRLTRDTLTEDILEEFFGLPSTTRDPLSDGLKLGDENNQIKAWKFKDVVWNRDTDPDGFVYLKFETIVDAIPGQIAFVKVYRNSQCQDKDWIAEGSKIIETGSLILGFSGALRGRMSLSGYIELGHINTVSEINTDSIIKIALVPRFLCWRLQYLRDLWQQQDWQSNPYIQHKLPIIDPDLIGPEDFRDFTSRNQIVDLWWQRRSQLDKQFQGIQSAIHEYGLTVTIEKVLIKSIDRIGQLLKSLKAGNASRIAHRELKKIGLSQEALVRLIDLYQKQINGNLLDLNEQYEICSILLQKIKQNWRTDWYHEEQKLVQQSEDDEENNDNVQQVKTLLSPRFFWTSKSQPQEGSWPPIQVKNNYPFIDPEQIEKADLPSFMDQQLASAIWDQRNAELQASRASLEYLMQRGLSLPSLITSAIASKELTKVPHDIKVTTCNWLETMKAKAEAAETDPSHPPLTDQDVESIFQRLVSLEKYQKLYSKWLIEEHQKFPVIDPEVIKPENLADIGDSPMTSRFWKRRQVELDNIQYKLQKCASTHDFSGMLRLAWNPSSSSAVKLEDLLVNDMYKQFNDARKRGDRIRLNAAISRIVITLHIPISDFEFIVDICTRKANGSIIAQKDWEKSIQVLRGAYKLSQGYDRWRSEERNEFSTSYFYLHKTLMPKWRASQELRQQWQLVLERNSQPPIIDPAIINIDDIRESGSKASSLLAERKALAKMDINPGIGKPRWSIWNSEELDLDSPAGCALDSQGNLYVADYSRTCIKKVSPTGHLLKKWGKTGTGNGEFNAISDIAIDSHDQLYAVDANGQSIQKFDSSGNFISRWQPEGDYELSVPGGIAIDDEGTVYVADSGNNRILLFDSTGDVLDVWEADPEHPLNLPRGIAVDARGYVYVADTDNEQIQKFDDQGNWLQTLGKGVNDIYFKSPIRIAVDSQGCFYVLDSAYNSVQKLDAQGHRLAILGHGEGDAVGQFKRPWGIAVDSWNKVYVTDSGNNRIQAWTATQGLDDVVRAVIGVPLKALWKLSQERDQGNDIAYRLSQLNLLTEDLLFLNHATNLLRNRTRVWLEDWEEVFSTEDVQKFSALLAHVQMRRQFANWRAEEAEANIYLSPDYFQLSDIEPEELAQNRTLRRDRRNWQDKLEARD